MRWPACSPRRASPPSSSSTGCRTRAGRPGPNVALADAQRAMRLIRHRAGRYGVDPERLCAMGFSAGGHVCADLLTRFDAPVYEPVDAADRLSARPDAAAPIYPVISMTAPDRPCRLAPQPDRRECLARARARSFAAPQRAAPDCPPTFLLHAEDDRFGAGREQPAAARRAARRTASRPKPISSPTAATASASGSPAANPSNTGPTCSPPGRAARVSGHDRTLLSPFLAPAARRRPAAAAQSRAEIERTMRRATQLHGRGGRDQWRLCLVLSARHVAPLGRDRGQAER